MSLVNYNFLGNSVANNPNINLPNIKASSKRFEIKTNGISQLFIDSQGKVGIGTSDPNQLLHLYQPDNNDVNIKITNDVSTEGSLLGVDTDNNLQIRNRDNNNIEFWTNDTQHMTFTNQGKLGIHTISPQESIHLHQEDSGSSYIRFTNVDASSGVNIGLDSGEAFVIRQRENDSIKLYTNDLERITLRNNGTVNFNNNDIESINNLTVDGLVGIGITNPSYILQLKGDGYERIFLESTGAKQASVDLKTLNKHFRIICDGFNNNDFLNIYDQTNNVSRFTIAPDGEVGIGTTTPSQKLDVVGNIASNSFIFNGYTTTERNALTPSTGQVVYDTTVNKLYVYTGVWEQIQSL